MAGTVRGLMAGIKAMQAKTSRSQQRAMARQIRERARLAVWAMQAQQKDDAKAFKKAEREMLKAARVEERAETAAKELDKAKVAYEKRTGAEVEAKSVMAVVSKAWTAGKKEGQKEAREKYEALRKKLLDDKADLREKQDALKEYIQKHLPLKVRAVVMGQINALNKAAKPETRQKYFERALAAVNEAWAKNEKREALERISTLMKRGAPVKDRDRGIMVGKMTAEIQREVNRMRAAAGLSGEKVTEALEAIVQASEGAGRDMTPDELRQFRVLQLFGDIREKGLAEILKAEEELRAFVEVGKFAHEVLEEKRIEENRVRRDVAMKEFTGGKGEMPTEKRLLEQAKRGTLRWWRDQLRNLDDAHQSWEWLLDKFARFDKAGILQSKTGDYYSRLVHRAGNSYNVGMEEMHDVVSTKAQEIFGKKGWELSRALSENSKQVEDSGVFRYVIDEESGTAAKISNTPLALSQNQAYKLWQWMQDPTLADSLAANGYTDETRAQLEKFLKPQVRAWAEWQINEFYPMMYGRVNDVYRRMFYIDLPFNEKYTPLAREYESGKDVVDDGLLEGAASHYGSVISGHLKSRVKNKRPPKLMDGDSMMMSHVVQMEHFRAWGEPMRELRSVFGSEQVIRAVKDYHGAGAANVLRGFLDDFARGGVDRSKIIPLMDKLRGNFAVAVLGVNPKVFLQQLASIPAFAGEIPAGQWALRTAKLLANPMKYKARMEELMASSPTLRARGRAGYERDVIQAMQRSVSQGIADSFNISGALMSLTRYGDMAAILIGGFAAYEYHYDQGIKKGMSPEDAHKRAVEDFEMAAERTQQAGGVKDLGAFQRGGSWAKLWTMFMTAPLAYLRQNLAAVRAIRHGKPGASKRLLMHSLMMPIIFQWIASAFEWEWDDQIYAILASPFSGMIGLNYATSLIRSMTHGFQVTTPGAPPPFSALEDLTKGGMKISKGDVWEGVDSVVEGLSKGVGIPYGPARRIGGGAYDYATGETDDIRRMLGYSEWMLERGEEEPPAGPPKANRPERATP
jgi:hypothetical protein